MIVPTYLTLHDAVQFLSNQTAQPVTTNWLLQHASEEKLQIFFHPQRLVVTGKRLSVYVHPDLVALIKQEKKPYECGGRTLEHLLLGTALKRPKHR
ncbi:hypothetical protein ACO0K9_18590 [Undibacterium sp. Ji50W]|uniref:hypothetical protein n=1 Tax=Undibacterium sp. Ji50W TaxID=3413041 RepID=UPI003BEFE9CA